jgi:hypothetical protein
MSSHSARRAEKHEKSPFRTAGVPTKNRTGILLNTVHILLLIYKKGFLLHIRVFSGSNIAMEFSYHKGVCRSAQDM